MIQIIPMSSEHLSQVQQIEFMSQPDPWSISLFESCLSDRYINFVAIENNQVLGFLIADWVVGDACLMNLCVAPKYRNHGIAQALHQQFFAQLVLRNTENLTLEVRASNISAQSLYKKLGYQQIALRQNYYVATQVSPVEDAVIMQHALA